MASGRILKQQKGLYTLEDTDGNNRFGRAGSRIRKEGIKLLAGDIVSFAENPDGSIFINSVEKRQNALIRPPVANVDMMVLVVASTSPEPDLFNIDCMLAIADANNIHAIIAVNKSDLSDAQELCEMYRQCGYTTFAVCGAEGKGVDELYSALSGVCVFAGQSGVGKSTIINKLFPSLSLQTGEISERIQRGKNTTRHTELFNAGNGLYITDTPGFGMLDFYSFDLLTLEQLDNATFPEFTMYRSGCRYRGCTHIKEEGCAIIEAVNKNLIPTSRHESYVRLKNELLKKEYFKYKR